MSTKPYGPARTSTTPLLVRGEQHGQLPLSTQAGVSSDVALSPASDDEQERRSTLLLPDETGSSGGRLDRRLTAPLDEREQPGNDF